MFAALASRKRLELLSCRVSPKGGCTGQLEHKWSLKWNIKLPETFVDTLHLSYCPRVARQQQALRAIIGCSANMSDLGTRQTIELSIHAQSESREYKPQPYSARCVSSGSHFGFICVYILWMLHPKYQHWGVNGPGFELTCKYSRHQIHILKTF